MVGRRLIGVMDLQSTRIDGFSEDDIRVQQTLAAQIAVAIQNAQLYEDIYRQQEVTEGLRAIGAGRQ